MTNKISIADLPDFDLAEHLKDDEEIATYLKLVIEEGDVSELTHALRVVARARGMNEIAKISGITHETLYKSLRSGAKPRFDTINRVCKALGVSVKVSARV